MTTTGTPGTTPTAAIGGIHPIGMAVGDGTTLGTTGIVRGTTLGTAMDGIRLGTMAVGDGTIRITIVITNPIPYGHLEGTTALPMPARAIMV